MAKQAAGVLLHREREGTLEVFLVHPGGPFWARKDEGAWSLPKGEFGPGEDAKAAALREFAEETGQAVSGDMVRLSARRQPGGKTIHAFAMAGDCDAGNVRSNAFTMEWPPRSGKFQEFPEVDRGAWFTLEEARKKIMRGQAPYLDELQSLL